MKRIYTCDGECGKTKLKDCPGRCPRLTLTELPEATAPQTVSPSNSSDLLAPWLDEPEVLACDPFEGDFGGTGDRTLKDKMVNARKPGPCHLCGQEIQKGERIRTRADITDGDMMSYRWCNACCHAMALSWTDDGKAWEHRASLAR